jgi:hypothetical protein
MVKKKMLEGVSAILKLRYTTLYSIQNNTAFIMEVQVPNLPIVEEFHLLFPQWELILQRADRRSSRPADSPFQYNCLYIFIFDPTGSIHLRFTAEIDGDAEAAERLAVERALKRFMQAYRARE